MGNFRSRLAPVLLVSLLAAGGSPYGNAQPAGTVALKLVPIPREVTAGVVQPLAGGVQINCATPCAAEDTFGWLAGLGRA